MFFDWSTIKKLIWLRAAGVIGAVWKTITNVAVASFTAVAAPVRALVIDITPVQAGSGNPSPENVRPISGWTGARIFNNFARIVNGKTVTGSGNRTAVSANDAITVSFGSATTKGTLLTVGMASEMIALASSFSGVVKCSLDAAVTGAFSITGVSFVFSKTGEADISVANGGVGTLPDGYALKNITCDAFAPASGNSVSITNVSISPAVAEVSWQTEAGTVYGGTLGDNGNGTWTLTATMAGAKIKDILWEGDPTPSKLYFNVAKTGFVPAAKGGTTTTRFMCSCYPRAASEANQAWWQTNNAFRLKDTAFSTLSDFINTETGRGNEMVVWELATPQTYTLTAESVETLLGQNNVWADTGNINTITYRES